MSLIKDEPLLTTGGAVLIAGLLARFGFHVDAAAINTAFLGITPLLGLFVRSRVSPVDPSSPVSPS